MNHVIVAAQPELLREESPSERRALSEPASLREPLPGHPEHPERRTPRVRLWQPGQPPDQSRLGVVPFVPHSALASTRTEV